MKARHLGFALLMILASAGAAGAQDVKSQEIMVVDKACQERKVLLCVSRSHVYANCLPSERFWYPDDTSPNRQSLCRVRNFDPHVYVAQGQPMTFNFTLPVVGLGGVNAEMFSRVLTECSRLAEMLPSAMGENCLRPLAEERLLNAWTTDLRAVLKAVCQMMGKDGCASLDQIPPAPQ